MLTLEHLRTLDHASIIDLASWRICQLLEPSEVYPEGCTAT